MTPLGWCLTGNHSDCRVTVGEVTCSCKCSNHGQSYAPAESGASERIIAIIERYKIAPPPPPRK